MTFSSRVVVRAGLVNSLFIHSPTKTMAVASTRKKNTDHHRRAIFILHKGGPIYDGAWRIIEQFKCLFLFLFFFFINYIYQWRRKVPKHWGGGGGGGGGGGTETGNLCTFGKELI